MIAGRGVGVGAGGVCAIILPDVGIGDEGGLVFESSFASGILVMNLAIAISRGS